MKEVNIEICANGLFSMDVAQKLGVTRIELCENLEIGGTTPSYGCLQMASQIKTIETRVLIRPRSGHYCYSESEIQQMLFEIEFAKSLGFDGIVIGALKPDGTIDDKLMKLIRKAASKLKLTFHRAIDASADPIDAIKILIDLGVDTVLTSGAQPTASQGIVSIKQMQQLYGSQIEILAGGGINASNAIALIKESGINSIHLSAKKTNPTPQYWSAGKDPTGSNMQTTATDAEEILQLLNKLKVAGYTITQP